MLIALLNDEGFTGFEETEKELKAFIPSVDFDREKIDKIPAITAFAFTVSTVDEKNWNEKWEADFEPVAVPDPATGKPFAYIRAGFHQENTEYPYDIIVTPKMSFGTGHHATTYLMTSQMAAIDFKNKSVIDFGTGTGILAILAEKMGAASVTAIDCDDWSINNAKENLDVNACNKYDLIKAETIPADKKAQVILANINLNIIIENLPAIRNAALPGAIVLFSGVLITDETHITNKITASGFEVTDLYKKDNWMAIAAKG